MSRRGTTARAERRAAGNLAWRAGGLRLLVALALWLTAACSGSGLEACGKARKLVSERSAVLRGKQQAGAGAGALKPKPWRPPKREPGGNWRTLSFFMPDSIEGFRARMGRDGRDIDVGGSQPLLTVRRSYQNKDGVILDLELIDTGASPRLRELFGRTRELARDNDRAVFRALKVQGQRAFTQWLDASKSARTSVLVAERFLLNVDTKPVSSPALGQAVAQKLELPRLVELAGSAALPRAVVQDGGSATSPLAIEATPEPMPPSAAADADKPASGAARPETGLPPAAAEAASPDSEGPGDDLGQDSAPP